jgi:hypothetical protein
MFLKLAFVVAPQLILLVADNVPVFNVEPMCVAVAQEHNMTGLNRDSKKAHDDCLDSEAKLRGQLERKWPEFALADKSECEREASNGGVQSYTELLNCLEIDQDVQKLSGEVLAVVPLKATLKILRSVHQISADVPTLDVEPMCLGISEEHNMTGLNRDPKKAHDTCVETEQLMRRRLANIWSAFPSNERTLCQSEVIKGGIESYTELLNCLEMTNLIKALHANTHDR